MTIETYSIRIDDLGEETIEADSEADCASKLAAHLRSDGLAHVSDDVNVRIRTPRGDETTSTVAAFRGHRSPG